MEPSPRLFADLEEKQRATDSTMTATEKAQAKEAAEQKTRTEIANKVKEAQDLAEKVAHLSGGHVYLGRDARSRDYHSGWFVLEPLQDHPNVNIEVQLERIYKINRRGSTEMGQTFSSVQVNLRLFDTERDIATSEDGGVITFSDKGVILKQEDDQRLSVLPGTEEWEDVNKVLAVFSKN